VTESIVNIVDLLLDMVEISERLSVIRFLLNHHVSSKGRSPSVTEHTTVEDCPDCKGLSPKVKGDSLGDTVF